MKNLYLILSLLGFIAPNILVTKVSVETGNLLFWTKPMETMTGMFANDIAGAFMIDLLFIVMVFFLWSAFEAKRLSMRHPWPVWILTMLFGIAGAFPLFLYYREQALNNAR